MTANVIWFFLLTVLFTRLYGPGAWDFIIGPRTCRERSDNGRCIYAEGLHLVHVNKDGGEWSA